MANGKTRVRLLGCVSVMVLSAGEAYAQNESAEASLTEQDTIVVTAQKREEKLQDVPISVSVLSGDELDRGNFQEISDALREVSGVSIYRNIQGGASKVSVRGVTASGPLFNGSSPIGYYVDNVPFGFVKTSIAPDMSPYDLERVEVLRGPQGTLYGVGALNGVVRVLTADPDLNAFDFKARSSIATTDGGGESYRGDMAVNLPLIDGKLAARVVVGYNDVGGWIDKPAAGLEEVNDGELSNIRLKVRAQPTDNLTIDLQGWRSHSSFGAPSVSDEFGDSFLTADEPISTKFDMLGGTLTYDLTDFTITSSTSYIEYENTGFRDLGVVLQTDLFAEVFAEELLISSTHEGPWRWSLGGIYRKAEDRLFQDIPGLLPAPVDFSDVSESFAVFGELTRSFGDDFDLTVGLRYFRDNVDQIENVLFTAGLELRQDEATFDALTPRVVLMWRPNDDTSLYASYSQGFRSGFNNNPIVKAAAPDFPEAAEDKLTNYEVGAKGNVLDGVLGYEFAVFYIDWQDTQQTIGVPFGDDGLFVTGTINSEAASGFGVDVKVNAEPVENLRLGVSFGWNDLGADATVFDGGLPLIPAGGRLTESAEYTAGGHVSYSFPIGDTGFEGEFSGSVNYVSELLFYSAGVGAVAGDDLLTSRLSLAVNADENWRASVFVDNLTNEAGAVLPGRGGSPEARLRPRTVGLQLEYQY